MSTLPRIVEEVKKLAIRAGEAIIEVYTDPDQFQTEYKEDESPLTLADQRSNELIVEGLQKLPENWQIVSEESSHVPYEKRKDAEYLWVVDPLDGTKEFIKRNGEFTVNIALVHGRDPVMGVVYVPVTGALYWALRGEGSWKQAAGETVQLQCPSFDMEDENLRVVCSRSHLNEATENFMNALRNPAVVRKGSSLKFLTIAEGNADIYPRLGPTMEWDTAAAHCIVREAGGLVLREDNREPLRYNKPNLLNPHFIVLGDVSGYSDFRP